MSVPVMDIRIMRMLVNQLLVPVQMGVRLLAIPVEVVAMAVM